MEPALLAAGFTAERRLAVMACALGEVLDVATPPGIDLLLEAQLGSEDRAPRHLPQC